MRLSPSQLANVALGSGLLLAFATLVVAYLSITQLVESTRLEERAVTVLAQADAVAVSYSNMELTARIARIQRDEASITAFVSAVRTVRKEAGEFVSLAVDPTIRALGQRLSAAVHARSAATATALTEAGLDRTRLADLESGAVNQADNVHALLESIFARQRTLVGERRVRAERSVIRTSSLIGGGGLIAVLLMATAILQLKRYQAQRDAALARLSDAERRLDLALKGSQLAVWDWDIVGDEMFLDPTWSEMLGGPAEPTVTTSAELMARVPPKQAPLVRESLAAVLRGEESAYDVEHRVRRLDGSWMWVRSRGGVSQRGPDGTALRMTGTNADITRRRAAEEALRASEQRLRLVADSVPAMIVQIDAEERYRFHNRAFAEFTGRRDDEIHGHSIREVLGDAVYAEIEPHLRRALAGQAVAYERQRTRPDGSVQDLAVRYVPQRTADDEVTGMVALVTDVSELKQLDRMKDAFVATVSHELRTPLTSIRAALAILDGGGAGPVPPAAARMIGVAASSCERLVRLVNDILDFERMRSGAERPAVQPMDAVPPLSAAIAGCEAYAASFGVQLAYVPPAGDARVLGSPDELVQVATNLVSNAIKFSPRGETVRVGVEIEGAWLRVKVQDRGPGIPESFRPRVFEPFSRADAAHVRERGGTGLGLSIARSLVDRMGGHIGFDSTPGQGSVFWFELRRARDPAARHDADAQRDSRA